MTINEIIKGWREKFYLQEDSPLYLERDERMENYIRQSFPKYCKEMLEKCLPEEKELKSPMTQEGIGAVVGFNSAIAEMKKNISKN